MKIRGQVKKYLPAAIKMGATAETMLNPAYRSPNLNQKDKVQMAEILRGRTAWAKEQLAAARKVLHGPSYV